ncbi:MAG: tetratricopeptide repeat protein [Anaerolineae bacterium]
MVARLARRQGDRATSRALAAESRDLSEAAGDDVGVARSLLVIATEGAVADWAPTVEDSLERFRRAGDLAGVARALQSLGNAVSYQGDYVAARTHFEQSVAIRRAIGDLWGLEDLLNNLGVTAFGLGQLEAARALHEEALAMRRRVGSAPGIAQSELNLASIDVATGDAASARDRLRAMLPRHIEHDARIGLVECMEWTACVAAQSGDPATALVLFGAADTARAAYADPLDRMFTNLHGRLRAAAEAALAPDAAAAALAEGRALSHAQAVERTARYLGAG